VEGLEWFQIFQPSTKGMIDFPSNEIETPFLNCWRAVSLIYLPPAPNTPFHVQSGIQQSMIERFVVGENEQSFAFRIQSSTGYTSVATLKKSLSVFPGEGLN
jgi:hypothetical protein